MDRKKHTVGKVFGFIAMLLGAAMLGFAVCVVIRYFIENNEVPTELLYGEERPVSEFQEFFYDDPNAPLEWAVDGDIIEIDGKGEEGTIRAVGVGKTHVTVTDTLLEAIGGDSVVFSFDITVSFCEEAVDSAVRAALGLGRGDKIAKDALLSLTALDLSETDLASCGDLVPMAGLRKVDLSDCKSLKDVSALYRGAFSAEEVDLSGAGIAEIDFSRLSPNIKKIDVSGTELTALSLAGSGAEEIAAERLLLTAGMTVGGSESLEKLSLRGTQIPSLTMDGEFPALAALDLGGANILGGLTLSADFPVLARPEFGGMTVRGAFTLGGSFSIMTSLQIKDVTLNSLDVRATLPAVTSAEVAIALKEGFTFSPAAPLLSSVAFTGLDVKGAFNFGGDYPKMTTIALGGLNAEGGLTISGTYAGAEELSLGGTSAASVTVLASLPVLRTISLNGLTAKSVSVNAQASAERFDFTDASIGGEVRLQGASKLTELVLDGAEISALSLTGGFGSLSALAAENAQIGTLSLSGAELPLLAQIVLPQAGIGTADLGLERMASLSRVDLSGNRLQSFAMPAVGSSSLAFLDLSGNALSYFTVGGNFSALQTLSLSGNALSSFALSVGLEKLAALSVGCESLTALSLNGTFPELKTVNCAGANKAAVSLKGTYGKLDTIFFPSAVSSLTLDGTFSMLRSVEGGSSQIEGASFAGSMKGLTKIDLRNAGLKWIGLEADFPDLEELLLDGATLDSFSLHGNYPKLGQLSLNGLTTTAAGVSLEGEYPMLKALNAENMSVSGNVELKGSFGKYTLDLNGLQTAGSQDPSLIFSEGNTVTTFSFIGAQLSTLTAASLPELVSLDGSSAYVGTAVFSDMPKLTTCTLKSAGFGSLELRGSFDALVGLNFKEANVTSLKVSADFATLESFSAENTSMGSADLNGAVFEKLTSLDLSGNRLTRFTLNFTADKMSGLDLSDNRLETFSVADSGQYDSLKNVDIGGNGSSAAGLDLTLGGTLPKLDSFTFTGSTFGTITLNGTFDELKKISLSNVIFKKIAFGEKWHAVSDFTVAFTETEEYVYGNLPMPAPFSLMRAGNADKLKSVAKSADGSTLVCAAFDGSFGGELTVSSDAERFGLYGKCSYSGITLRPTNRAAKLYFYNVTLTNESGSVIDLQSASTAELHFYGTCSLGRSGAGISEATIKGQSVSLISNNVLEIRGRNGADATAEGESGADGTTAISCTELALGGKGNIRIWGGNGGNGMKGDSGVNGDSDQVAAKGINGKQGGNGGNGAAAVQCSKINATLLGTANINGGNGGDGGSGGNGGVGKTGKTVVNIVTGGKDGNKNYGGTGGSGGKGGNGGTPGLGIPANCSVNKRTNISDRKGSYGHGGDGGNGGSGGQGGNYYNYVGSVWQCGGGSGGDGGDGGDGSIAGKAGIGGPVGAQGNGSPVNGGFAFNFGVTFSDFDNGAHAGGPGDEGKVLI